MILSKTEKGSTFRKFKEVVNENNNYLGCHYGVTSVLNCMFLDGRMYDKQ